MRFSIKPQTTILIVVAVYVLHLGVQDDLNLYIHPRYIIFTVVMAVICFILLAVQYVSGDTHDDSHSTRKLAGVPLALMLLFALFVPARTLTSATVSQRSTDAGSLVTTSDSRPINTLFAGSSKALKLADWSRLLSSNSDASYYANKPARISGFVYDAGLGENVVWIARFVVTCCAVDAQPIGVPAYIEGWEGTYEEDQWLEVEGMFELETTAEGESLVLVPTSVAEIDQPRNPYGN